VFVDSADVFDGDSGLPLRPARAHGPRSRHGIEQRSLVIHHAFHAGILVTSRGGGNASVRLQAKSDDSQSEPLSAPGVIDLAKVGRCFVSVIRHGSPRKPSLDAYGTGTTLDSSQSIAASRPTVQRPASCTSAR
jgi:hypothetical protein